MGLEDLHRRPDEMVDQDHLGFVQALQPEQEEADLYDDRGEEQGVVAVEGPIRCQTFMTGTDAALFEQLPPGAARYDVAAGKVEIAA